MKINMFKKTATLIAFLLIATQGIADVWGKVDVAPAYIHVDVLQDNKVINQVDMGGFKGDATIILYKGFCLKPSILYARNGADLFTAGVSLGHCFPLGEKWVITPTIGYSYTHMSSPFTLPGLDTELKQHFHSFSPNVGLEVAYQMTSNLRFCGQVQYAWSKTKTEVKNLIHADGKAAGPLFGAMVEYDINDRFSVNVGAAYNLSLSKEKHGIRGYGIKAGLSYWF